MLLPDAIGGVLALTLVCILAIAFLGFWLSTVLALIFRVVVRKPLGVSETSFLGKLYYRQSREKPENICKYVQGVVYSATPKRVRIAFSATGIMLFVAMILVVLDAMVAIILASEWSMAGTLTMVITIIALLTIAGSAKVAYAVCPKIKN